MNDSAGSVRLLLVEGNLPEAKLLIDEMRRDGLDIRIERVDQESAFVDALQRFEPDLILADLGMPEFSGYRALEIARECVPLVPFLFVSGKKGEDAAVEALRAGATDYVLRHNLKRLAPAVRRALADAAERRERVRVEQDLVRVQRYESLALLASGLSHDLRNVLQPISMGAAVLHESKSDEVRKVGKLIAECTQRGLDIVASMLSFASGSHAVQERVNVKGLLDGLVMLLRGTLPDGVSLLIEPVDAQLEIDGNHTELQQCLLNLCLNAIQAMEEGGDLHLSTQAVHLDAEFFEHGESCNGQDYLKLEVTDSGSGMSDEVRKNLFQPFFTTKSTGTGLGLLSCRRTISNHCGVMRVASEAGRGTRFSLYLPLPVESTHSLNVPDIPRGQHQRVLIVVETASKLSLLCDVVGSHGYRVTAAQDGIVALQSLDKEGLPDAVIMEAEMNLMTGVKSVSALVERDFSGPVILIARRDSAARQELPPLRRIRFIDKPVDPAQMLGVLAEEFAKQTD